MNCTSFGFWFEILGGLLIAGSSAVLVFVLPLCLWLSERLR